jgi:hypothetical protein
LTLSLVDPMLVEVTTGLILQNVAHSALHLRYPMSQPILGCLRERLPTLRLLALGPKVYQIAHLASG